MCRAKGEMGLTLATQYQLVTQSAPSRNLGSVSLRRRAPAPVSHPESLNPPSHDVKEERSEVGKEGACRLPIDADMARDTRPRYAVWTNGGMPKIDNDTLAYYGVGA